MGRIVRVGTSESQRGRRRRFRSRALAALLATALAGLLTTVVSSRADAVAFNVTLTLQPTAIQASTAQTTTATATVTYQGVGQPNQWVKFTSNGDATVVPPPGQTQPQCFTVGTTGQCAVQIRAGTTSGPQTIKATIVDSNGNPNPVASGSATKTLYQYNPPLSMAVSFAGGINRIAPNGSATTTAVATLTDVNGAPVPGQAVTFATDATTNPVTLTSFHDVGNGTYTKVVSSPAILAIATQPTTQTITATATAWATSGSAPLTLGYGALHTNGNAIYDDFDRPVTIQGGDVYAGWHIAPHDPYPETVVHMAAAPFQVPSSPGTWWGFNTVRMELSDAYWFSTVPYSASDQRPCGTVYKETVAEVVNQVTSRGMLALLDLHAVPEASTQTGIPPSQLPCGEGGTGPAAVGLRPMADAAYAPDFWTQVATAYKDNPMVAFELYNEPLLAKEHAFGQNCDSHTIAANSPQTEDGVWHDGGQLLSGDVPGGLTSVAGMQTLHDRVRATGANNLVVIGGRGPNVCGESAAYDVGVALRMPVTPAPGLQYPNIVYSSHPYWQTTCGNIDTPLTGLPPDRDQVIPPVAARYPVIFSEFGSPCSIEGRPAEWNKAVIDYAVAHNLGWIQYPFERLWSNDSWGTYQCDPHGGACTEGTKTYAYYEASDRGVPAYNQLHAAPNHPNPLN